MGRPPVNLLWKTAMTKPFPIERAVRDPRLFGAGLGDIASWQTWLTVLRAAFGSPLSQSNLNIFAQVAGGRAPPSRRVRELWAICGRRSGKSRMAALVSGFIATCTDRGKLAPGERPMVLTLAATRDQAQVVHGYTLGSSKRRRSCARRFPRRRRTRSGCRMAW